jgi:hypothetical protein
LVLYDHFLHRFYFHFVRYPQIRQQSAFYYLQDRKKTVVHRRGAAGRTVASCYVLLLLLGSVLVSAKYSFWGNVWSNFTVNYKTDYEGILSNNNRFIDQQVFKYYMPFPALIHCILLLTLCLTLMGTVILLFSIINKKLIGIILNVILIIFVLIFNKHHIFFMWVSPFCHAVLALHNTYIYKQLSVPPCIFLLLFDIFRNSCYFVINENIEK